MDPEVELVITAPEPYGAKLAYSASARMTLGVLTQLLASAQESLVVAVPFLQQAGPLSTEPLASALRAALERKVSVDIVSTASGLRTLDLAMLRRHTRARQGPGFYKRGLLRP